MRSKQFTQHQKIIGYIIARKDQQEWFYAYDFMPPRMTLDYIYCVGYEATARFAELAGKYPDMIESVSDGKYKKRRIRWDTMPAWLPQLDKDLRYMFHRAKLTKDISREKPTKDQVYNDPEPRKAPEPPRTMKLRGMYKKKKMGVQDPEKDTEYDIEIERMVMGQPIKMVKPVERSYSDIKHFKTEWRII